MDASILRPEVYSPSITLPGTDPVNGATFPLSLAPSSPELPRRHLLDHVGHLSRSGEIGKLLGKHGAIYFQGLGLKTAQDFSDFAHAFGWDAHEDIGNPVRRTIHAKNVATANEGPNTQPVYPHNEFGLSPHYPAYVLFFCLSAPESGRILCSSHTLVQA